MSIAHRLRRVLMTFGVVAALPSGLRAQDDSMLDRFGIREVPARARAVQFRQIIFDYDVGRIAGSDWGQIEIQPKRLLALTNGCEAYVNVFIPDRAGRLSWVVDNVLVAPPDRTRCSGSDEEGRERARWDDPFASEHFRRPGHPEHIPVVKYLDLRPGVEGDGRMQLLRGVVWVSKSPVPNADEFLELAQSRTSSRYPVRPVVDNAEGDLTAMSSDFIGAGTVPVTTAAGSSFERRDRAIPGPSRLAIGPPPQAVLTKPLKLLKNILFPVGVFQSPAPNVNAARNQCVPAAHANALAYLEARYNFNPNIWDLPHHHVRGIGRLTFSGEFPIYEPVPPWSIVANVDFFTRRKGVFDLDSGGGTGGCANFLGLLKYLHLFGANAQVMRVRHQGAGGSVIGEDAGCDPGNLAIGGLQSHPEGAAPTWEWMRDQLAAGRSLVIGWGRYNDAGEWTGGHKVRVYGAAQLNGKKYLYMLDDGNQGDNFVGLRTFSFEVTDFHTPGSPWVPNGFLEIDGMATRQIVTAISVEPKPKFIFD